MCKQKWETVKRITPHDESLRVKAHEKRTRGRKKRMHTSQREMRMKRIIMECVKIVIGSKKRESLMHVRMSDG
jgi:hypothetical protein